MTFFLTRSWTSGSRDFFALARAFCSLRASMAWVFSMNFFFTRRRAISMSGWRRLPPPRRFRSSRFPSLLNRRSLLLLLEPGLPGVLARAELLPRELFQELAELVVEEGVGVLLR